MRGHQNVRVCPVRFSGPFDAQAKVVSPPKKCTQKCPQNGCPCFGTLSALICALKVPLLGFPKNALRKSRKLTCFASHKYAEIDPPFLTPKKGVSRWILTVKICKPREYMGPKMATSRVHKSVPHNAQYCARWTFKVGVKRPQNDPSQSAQ